MSKENWKSPILAKITDYEDNKAAGLALDDAWQRAITDESAI
jgi:hypothetical protein